MERVLAMVVRRYQERKGEEKEYFGKFPESFLRIF
jgi:hypothetical protein